MAHRTSEKQKPSKYIYTNKNPPSGLSGRRVGFFFFCCLLPHSRQRQEQDEHGAANVQRRVFVYSSDGGGEESRTPVRKSIHAAFYECSLSIKFPSAIPANRRSSSVFPDTSECREKHFRRSPLFDALSRLAVLPGKTAALVRQRKLNLR